MSTTLLNSNQERRLASDARLLERDLAELARTPDLGGDVTAAIAAVQARLGELRREFALTPGAEPTLGRRVAAVAGVWAARMEDLKARHLRRYGSVHPDLGRRLDPILDELAGLLLKLAEAGAALPEA